MTKLAIISDLHIDLNQFGDFEIETLIAVLKEEKVSHLHLAGDISNHFYTVSQPFIEQMAAHFTVTYNLGNHDMLDLSEKEIQQLDFQIFPLGNRTLLSFHGWYDYSFYPTRTDAQNLKFKNTFWFDRRLKRSMSDKELTLQSAHRLEQTLARLDHNLIVSMHFVPHRRFTMTHERFKPFNAFLGSHIFHNIFKKYGVSDVVFGHAHRSYGCQNIEGVAYHSRPLGYIREWDLTIGFVSQHPVYNPSGTWNLSKRYNAVKNQKDFLAYKKKHLAEEFRRSITLFPLK
ncbi:phosphoesterase [Streptococcus chenjunshii]|uniref:Phosphoesterase n=1 Tax=Streptococcus chenjunshii TaxID=2173853 RepID=A0A372KLK3_9STRE|nr:metallophosphoesterase [Streptococcus chenjunshii]AXQ79033.1 phosphoesterase [Streptococcus chenjunshii]RFU51229.1 phosphoesterase [Streptococcus chenjunshii]RFU53157.1 phosphoesterase [Streptococcus chenjunshii]